MGSAAKPIHLWLTILLQGMIALHVIGVVAESVLTRRSWQKLIETLSDHFGKNASLGEVQRKTVLEYLLANASDGPRGGREGRKFGASIPSAQTPLRITEVPRWVREHQKVPADRWSDPSVKSRENCPACHKAAEQGVYGD